MNFLQADVAVADVADNFYYTQKPHFYLRAQIKVFCKPIQTNLISMTIGFGCAMAPNSFDSIGMEDEVEKVIECDLVDDDAFRTLEQKCNEAIKKWGQYYMWKDEFGGFWREFFEQAVFYGAINIAKYLNETRGMFKDIEDSETIYVWST